MSEPALTMQSQDQKQEVVHNEATAAAHAAQASSISKFKDIAKEYFKDSFGTLIQKPQGRPPNIWKQFISLNNKQRLTFAAGKWLEGYGLLRWMLDLTNGYL